MIHLPHLAPDFIAAVPRGSTERGASTPIRTLTSARRNLALVRLGLALSSDTSLETNSLEMRVATSWLQACSRTSPLSLVPGMLLTPPSQTTDILVV